MRELPKVLPHGRLRRALVLLFAGVQKYPIVPAPCAHCGTRAVRGWIERDILDNERFFVEYAPPFCRFCGPREEFWPLLQYDVNVMRYWSYNG